MFSLHKCRIRTGPCNSIGVCDTAIKEKIVVVVVVFLIYTSNDLRGVRVLHSEVLKKNSEQFHLEVQTVR